MVERVWFLNTEVSFLVAREEEAYGISILEHHAAFGDCRRCIRTGGRTRPFMSSAVS